MPTEYEQDLPPEEELRFGGRTPRAVRLALVGMAVIGLGAIAIVLTNQHSNSVHGGTATTTVPPSNSPSRQLIANDVLIPGTSSGWGVDAAAHQLQLTGELINISDSPLTVDYPIQIYGTPLGTPARVTTAVLADSDASELTGSPLPLSVIQPHQHVVLWIGLRVSCFTGSRYRPNWPTGRTSIAIPLHGYPGPAMFQFRDVLGFTVHSAMRGICPNHPARRARRTR